LGIFFYSPPLDQFIHGRGIDFSYRIYLPKLETGFLPAMDEGSIVLDYASPPGTSLEETDRMLREAERSLRKYRRYRRIQEEPEHRWDFLLPNPIAAII